MIANTRLKIQSYLKFSMRKTIVSDMCRHRKSVISNLALSVFTYISNPIAILVLQYYKTKNYVVLYPIVYFGK